MLSQTLVSISVLKIDTINFAHIIFEETATMEGIATGFIFVLGFLCLLCLSYILFMCNLEIGVWRWAGAYAGQRR